MNVEENLTFKIKYNNEFLHFQLIYFFGYFFKGGI